MRTPQAYPILTAALCFLAACSDSTPRAAPESAPAAGQPAAAAAPAAAPAPAAEGSPLLAAAVAAGVLNAHEPAPGLLTSGQITREQMDALADAGYKTFVSLRFPTEQGAGWEEAYASERKVWFVRLPIEGAADLTRANVEALDQTLDAASDGPVAIYCGSSNRVGAMLALRARWMDGAPPEDALALGKAAGLTRLEPEVARLLGLAGTP